MRWLWIFVWTYLVFVLHTGFARELQIAGCTPHLVLAGLILMIVRTRGRDALVVAAGWGFLSDCLAGGRLGTDLLAFVLAAYVIRELTCRWNLDSPGRVAVVSAPIVWAALVASTLLRTFPEGIVPDLAVLAGHAAGSAIFTAMLIVAATLAAGLFGRSSKRSDPAATTVSNKWRMLAE